MTADTALDLSASIPLDTFTLKILLPGTTKPSGWEIVIAGPAHPQTVAMSNELQREIMDKEAAQEFAIVNRRKYKVEEQTPDDRRRAHVKRICQRIVSWSPNPTFKNISPEPLKFSPDAAVDLFMRPDMGSFFVQITDYITGEQAFIRPSETN